MTGWLYAPLGDVCDVVAGGTPSRKNPKYFGGDIPWVKISDMLQGTITYTEETITKAGIQNSSAKILPSGTVLISIFATIGRTALLGIDAATNQAIVGVIPKSSQLNTRFLRYYLDNSVSELIKEARGVAQVNINSKILKSLKIPLPPLTEQERIVCLLDEAEELRKLRDQASERMEEFVPALFHEMFGDPTKNTKTWQVLRFGEICESRLGKMLDEKQQSGLHLRPYLRNQNVQWGKVDVSNMAQMDFDEKDREIFRLREGDLLICEGGEVGRTAIWHKELPECYFQKAVHRARANLNIVLPEFILWTMYALSKSGGFADFTSQSTIAHLTGVKLKQLPIPVPPLALQYEFAQRVQEAREIQSRQAQSAERIDALYQSMLSKAFAGEL